jgi:ELP3 family radical SAM enzyme/protein acetyltransferase
MDIEDYFSQNKATLSETKKEQLEIFIRDLCKHEDITNETYQKYLTKFCRTFKWTPQKTDILDRYFTMIEENFPEHDGVRTILIKKKSNTLAGIATAAIMAKSLPIYRDENGKIKVQNYTCKHDCWFCPDERIDVLEFIVTIYEKFQISLNKMCLIGLFLMSSRAEEIFGEVTDPNIYEETEMDRLLCSFVGKIIVSQYLGDNYIKLNEYDWYTLSHYIKMVKNVDIDPQSKGNRIFLAYIIDFFDSNIDNLFSKFSRMYEDSDGFMDIFDDFNEKIKSKNKAHRRIKNAERKLLERLFDVKQPETLSELLNQMLDNSDDYVIDLSADLSTELSADLSADLSTDLNTELSVDLNTELNAEGLLPGAAEMKYEETELEEKKLDTSPLEWNDKIIQSFNMQITRFVMGYPRSYLSNEPAVMRGEMNRQDHVLQFYNRCESLRRTGHPTDKIEAIPFGGTFSEFPRPYNVEMARDIYYAGNTFSTRHGIPRARLTLEEEMKLNETSKVKIIGYTIETRPDSIVNDPAGEIELLRRIGCTRVQIGIQHVKNSILKGINRGHSIRTVYKCMEILKYNGFKVCGHFMHGLPDASINDDLFMNHEITENPYLQVDELKVYPYSVVPYSKFYDERETLNLHTKEELYNLVKDLMSRLNYWQREDRVVRDIPSTHIHGGCNMSHMGQVLNADNISRRSIRHREVKDRTVTEPVLKVRQYQDTSGISYWLSFESKDEEKLYSMLRLFFPLKNNVYQQDVLKGAALVREIHTYGKLRTTTNKKTEYGHKGNKSQHMGFGTMLLEKATEIAYQHGFRRIAVISGNSVRDYYRKRGYYLDRTYMIRELNNSYGWKLYLKTCFDKYIATLLIILCLFIGVIIGFKLLV